MSESIACRCGCLELVSPVHIGKVKREFYSDECRARFETRRPLEGDLMGRCEICGSNCTGRTCSGACRAKLSRRTRTDEAHG